MIAKLIVHGADRAAALARLRQALAEVEIAGVTTNVAFLRRVAASRAFAAAELDTGLIERNRAELFPRHRNLRRDARRRGVRRARRGGARGARARRRARRDPHSPWHRVDGWRLNEDSHHDFAFLDGATRARGAPAVPRQRPAHRRRRQDARAFAASGCRTAGCCVRLDGRAFKARAVRDGDDWHVFCDGEYRRLSLRQELAARGRGRARRLARRADARQGDQGDDRGRARRWRRASRC